MVNVSGSFEVSGPFFEVGRAKRETNAAILAIVQELVKVGQKKVKAMHRPGRGFVEGDLKRGVRRRVNKKKLRGTINPFRPQRGKANWIEDGKSHRPTRFTGYHFYRKGGIELDRLAPGETANHARVLVRKLN